MRRVGGKVQWTGKNEYQDCYLVSMSVVPTESSVCAVYTSEHGDNKIQKSAIVNECAFDQESRWEYFYQMQGLFEPL